VLHRARSSGLTGRPRMSPRDDALAVWLDGGAHGRVCILALAADTTKRRTHHSAAAALKTLSTAQAADAEVSRRIRSRPLLQDNGSPVGGRITSISDRLIEL
jgi:hypothetical protein